MSRGRSVINAQYYQIGSDALRALLYEVTTFPKPGLVDPVAQGPHPDMNVFTFIDSSVGLRHYFDQCIDAGATFTGNDLIKLFQAIRSFGIDAEKTMFKNTKGVNTHKGAIFSLGVLVTAESFRISNLELKFSIMEIVKRMLKGLTENDFKDIKNKNPEELTIGEREYLTHGIKGIRGEAESGFPVLTEFALPALKRSQGSTNERLLDTLMSILGNSIDTNLIKRANSVEIIDWAKQQSTKYFELGGSRTEEGMNFLKYLNEEFDKKNLSLGGSADLLILTIFIGFREGLL